MKRDNISRNIGLLMEHFEILSESQLARETGLGQATINKLVSGATEDPRLTTLLPIAERFNISLDTLVSDNPNFSPEENNKLDNKIIYIPIIQFYEINEMYNSLSALHLENWPYWIPFSKKKNSYFAVRINKESYVEPFNKASILILEITHNLTNGNYCLIKHIESNTISIMKTIKEAGQIWLFSLKKELPSFQYKKEDWQIFGLIRGLIIDMSEDNFFDFNMEQ